jgi:hypothetical protein
MDMHQKVGKRCSHEARKQVAFAKTQEDDANDSRDEEAKDGVFDWAFDDPHFANWADCRPGHKRQLFYGTLFDHDLKVIQSAEDVLVPTGENALKARANYPPLGSAPKTGHFLIGHHQTATPSTGVDLLAANDISVAAVFILREAKRSELEWFYFAELL